MSHVPHSGTLNGRTWGSVGLPRFGEAKPGPDPGLLGETRSYADVLLEPFRAGGVCDTGRRRFHYDPCAWMRGNPGRQGTARYDEGTFGIRDYPHQTNNTGHLELNRRRPRKCTVLPRLHQATPGDRFRQPCLSGPLSTSYLHDLTSSAPFPGCSKSQLLITYISYLFSPHSLTSSL